MNFPRSRVIFLSLISFVATASSAAGQQLPEKEEDIPVEYIPTFDNTMSIGASRVMGGAKVKFGNLGVVPQAPSARIGGRSYSNGSVFDDTPNGFERDLNGNPFTTDGKYTNYNGSTSVKSGVLVTVYNKLIAYSTDSSGATPIYAEKIDANGNYEYQTDLASTYRFLAYNNDGRTRVWNVSDPSQINTANHTVSMSTYGAGSAGATMEAKGGSTTGFELSWDRRVGQIGKLEIGISGGLSLGDVNMKTSGTVVSNLLSTTDVFTMVNTGLNTNYYNGGTDAGGNLISINQPSGNAQDLLLMSDATSPYQMYQYVSPTQLTDKVVRGDESVATPLNTNPLAGTEGVIVGSVVVRGNWQVKGAYYHMKLGPTLRYRFNDRWAVSGGFGVSMCWVGTVFKVEEQVYDIDSAIPLRSVEQNETHKFVPGYYGDFNAEYWVSERTGFYLGVNYQKLGNYSQNPLSGRTAKIDLGNSSGWRLGIMTRF